METRKERKKKLKGREERKKWGGEEESGKRTEGLMKRENLKLKERKLKSYNMNIL